MDQLVKIRTTTKHARGSRWSVALLLMAGVFIHAGPLSARSAPDSFAGLVEKLFQMGAEVLIFIWEAVALHKNFLF